MMKTYKIKNINEIPYESIHNVPNSRKTLVTKDELVSDNIDAMTKGILKPGQEWDWHQHIDHDEIGRIWNSGGSGHLDSRQNKFGGTSGYFDGWGNNISTIYSSDLNLGANNFTVDAWVYSDSFSNYRAIYDDRNNSSGTGFGLLLDDAGKVRLITPNAWRIITDTALNLNEWTHLALVRNGNLFTIYINGIADVNTYTASEDFSQESTKHIGCDVDKTNFFSGFIDEFRLSVGIARWTEDFSVALDEYSGPEPAPTATPILVSPPANSSLIFYDDFNDEISGDAWSYSDGTWTENFGIRSILAPSLTSVEQKSHISGLGDIGKDYTIMAKVRVNSWSDGDYSRTGLSQVVTEGMGYNLLFHNNHSTVQWLDDGIAWGPSYTYNWSNAVWYWFKMKNENGVLYGKVWVDGELEPVDWPYSWSRSGRTGIPALNGGSYNSGSLNSLSSFDDVSLYYENVDNAGNTVLNPGFELGDGQDADSWLEGTGFERNNENFYNDTYSIKSTSAGTNVTAQTVDDLRLNTRYYVGVGIYREADVPAYLDMNDIAGELTLTSTNIGSWEYLKGTFVNTGSSVTFRTITEGAGPVWFDDICFSITESECNILAPTATPTPLPTDTFTPIPTDTPLPTPTDTIAPTNTVAPTSTPIPTNTVAPTSTPVPTNTAVPIPTNTPTTIPTNTPQPTNTNLPTPTPTRTTAPTATRTRTPIPSHTPTLSITSNPTSTLTLSNTYTPTPIITSLPETGVTLTPTIKPNLSERLKLLIIGPDDEPVLNVLVKIGDNEYITDNTGYITIEDISSGTYSLTVIIDGKEYKQSVVLGSAGSNKTMTIQLKNDSMIPIIFFVAGGFVVILIGFSVYSYKTKKYIFKFLDTESN